MFNKHKPIDFSKDRAFAQQLFYENAKPKQIDLLRSYNLM